MRIFYRENALVEARFYIAICSGSKIYPFMVNCMDYSIEEARRL